MNYSTAYVTMKVGGKDSKHYQESFCELENITIKDGVITLLYPITRFWEPDGKGSILENVEAIYPLDRLVSIIYDNYEKPWVRNMEVSTILFSKWSCD